MPTRKLILVIGATGGQGMAVVDKLLAPAEDGSPSPYAVRALTRDPHSRRAKELADKGVELFKGSFDDFSKVRAALDGVWGVWTNTDGFTVGEAKEIHAGMRIFEIAKSVKSVRHFVWSSLDYSLKKGGFNPIYKCEHYNGKGRVADWLKAQPSVVSDSDMSWTVVTSGPYMEMLTIRMFGPIGQRADGTVVFASPIGNGHVCMTALEDLGFFARYAFDHRASVSGKDLEIASDWVGWDYLVSTFTKVTGEKADRRRGLVRELAAHGPAGGERAHVRGRVDDVAGELHGLLGDVAGRREPARLGVDQEDAPEGVHARELDAREGVPRARARGGRAEESGGREVGRAQPREDPGAFEVLGTISCHSPDGLKVLRRNVFTSSHNSCPLTEALNVLWVYRRDACKLDSGRADPMGCAAASGNHARSKSFAQTSLQHVFHGQTRAFGGWWRGRAQSMFSRMT